MIWLADFALPSGLPVVSIIQYGIGGIVALIGAIAASKARNAWKQGQGDEFYAFAQKKRLFFRPGAPAHIAPMRSPFMLGFEDSGYYRDPVIAKFAPYFPQFDQTVLQQLDTDTPPPSAINIMEGRDANGTEWTIFQLAQAKVGVTRHLIAESPVVLPMFSLRPETPATRAAKSAGKRELQVENHAFNDRYYIDTNSPDQVLHLLHPRAIDRIMYLPAATWDFNFRYIMVTIPGDASAQSLETYYNAIADFIRMIPNYYRKDYALNPTQ